MMMNCDACGRAVCKDCIASDYYGDFHCDDCFGEGPSEEDED